MPKAIGTDNGVPFASAHALFGLSKLAVWRLRLGIDIEHIKPGHPTPNDRHERIHLTLKKEATKPAARNLLQQQARFDDFIDCYNSERPHQALAMKYPVELYRASPRPYCGLSELRYPFHDRSITVTQCAAEFLEPVARRHAKVVQILGAIEHLQLALSLRLKGPESSRRAAGVKLLGVARSERPDYLPHIA